MMYQSFCAFLAIVIIGLVIAVIVLASKTKEQYRSSMMPTALPPRQITIFRPVQPTSLPSLSSKSNSNDIQIKFIDLANNLMKFEVNYFVFCKG